MGLASSGPLLSAPLLGQTVRPCATCSDKLGKEEEEEEWRGGGGGGVKYQIVGKLEVSGEKSFHCKVCISVVS